MSAWAATCFIAGRFHPDLSDIDHARLKRFSPSPAWGPRDTTRSPIAAAPLGKGDAFDRFRFLFITGDIPLPALSRFIFLDIDARQFPAKWRDSIFTEIDEFQ
ncbi:hypothetical protein [Burkholderia sp. AU45388]|uniref:hypothetical protein n=1 Tax=Burkholderia sp. AU45388 TaxID=3059206 RepID=UPI00264C9CFA|nr:hypothetical protein [Burkholderia sp. AU45388]MDN7425305.1 hypothetical protein [Burkholderia sp. AU45388]